MAATYVLYNLKAGYKTKLEDIPPLRVAPGDEEKRIDITRIKDYRVFLEGLEPEDSIVICGGDGTLNRFVNDTDGVECANRIFYYPFGTGNDFATDLGRSRGCEPFDVTPYIRDTPCVTVKGKRYRFINGVGYGIDGYCCEVGDEQKKTSDKPVSYTAIAIKGLLFHYKPTNARVTVDGVAHTYRRVWLAPTMNGRFYGGGMMPAPAQHRGGGEGTLSVMVMHDSGKLKTLTVFPSIFKGEHVRHTEIVDVLTGHEITVEFDRPVALQIDGETILGVTAYTAQSPVGMRERQPAAAAAAQ